MIIATDNVLTLRDGRRLGCAEYGDPDGAPVFYFHGFPGSRLEARLTADAGERLGVRVVAPDRPGYGLSDFQPGRRIPDWADDVAELADALGLARFSAVGVSGGGPYLMACAARIPDRLAGEGLVCPLGPWVGPGASGRMRRLHRFARLMCHTVPWLLGVPGGAAAYMMRRHGEFVVSRVAGRLAPPDRTLLTRSTVREALAASFREAMRKGSRAARCELGLYSRAWGVRPEDVRVPVRLWQGEQDVVIPPAMARHLAERIPDCRAVYFADEGHFSLPLNRTEGILAAVKPPA